MELFVVRALERVMAVLIGGLAIYLGYRLFLAVKATGEGSAEVKLPSDVTVMVSRVGPGVFFALFGALVVGTSYAFPIQYSETESQTAAGTSESAKKISGIGPGSGNGAAASTPVQEAATKPASSKEALDLERLRAREHIGLLNQTARLLDPSLPEAQRQRAHDRTQAAKLYLMADVWDAEWGRFEDFRLWAEGGGPPLDTEGFRRATEFFSYGQEGSR